MVKGKGDRKQKRLCVIRQGCLDKLDMTATPLECIKQTNRMH